MTRDRDPLQDPEGDELELWADVWQTPTPEPLPSLAKLRRRARRWVWLAIGQWLFGAMAVTAVTWLAWRDPRPTLIAAAFVVWAFVLIELVFDLRLRRGTWGATGSTTSDYVGLVRRQLVSRLRGLRFAWGILAAETAFFVAWIPWVLSERGETSPEAYLRSFGFFTAWIALFVVILILWQRRTRRELARFERSREGLVGLDRAA